MSALLWLVGLASAGPLPDLGPTLERDELIALVLARNPALARRDADARRRDEAIGRARAVPEPMLELMTAPGSFGSTHANPGLQVGVTQPLPGPGTLSARADIARAAHAEADAEREGTRRALLLDAIALYDALWRAERALDALDAHDALLEQLAAGARARYSAGSGSLQDPLEAEAARIALAAERLALTRERAVLHARLCGLIDADPQPLPRLPDGLPERDASEADALPSARAASARVEMARAESRSVRRENLPETALMGEYNSMWEMAPHRWMIGLGVRVPLALGARQAAVRMADAGLDAALADARGVDRSIAVEQAIAEAGREEADARLTLVRERQLPLADERLEAARQAYATGLSNFSTLVAAARGRLDARLALADALVALDLAEATYALSRGALPTGGAR